MLVGMIATTGGDTSGLRSQAICPRCNLGEMMLINDSTDPQDMEMQCNHEPRSLRTGLLLRDAQRECPAPRQG